MTKFHLSANGPTVCHATVRPCPVAGAEGHFANRKDAASAYEEKLAGESGSFATQKRPRTMDPSVLQAEAEGLKQSDRLGIWDEAWQGVVEGHHIKLMEFSAEDRGKTGRELAEALAAAVADEDNWDEEERAHLPTDTFTGVVQRRLSNGETIYAVRELAPAPSAFYTVVRGTTTYDDLVGRGAEMKGLLSQTDSIPLGLAGRTLDAGGWLALDAE